MRQPVKRIKVVMDFDGVWTDMQGQAAAVVQGAEERLGALVGLAAQEVRDLLAPAREHVQQNAHLHGWRMDGRVTAYADEDPYLMHNATMAAIDELAAAGQGSCQRLRDALVAAGWPSANAFGSDLFSQASHAYLADHGHDLKPEACDVLRALLEMADVVVCTNFASEAVERTWNLHGVACAAPGQAGLRIRGGARKQVLTADPRREWMLGGRPVAVDRGHYRTAIQEEQPDWIVGDVLSLDLALPLVLNHDAGKPLIRAALMRTPYSSPWALHLAANGEVPALELVEGLGQFAQRLAAAS